MCEYDTATSVRKWLYTGPKFMCMMASILLVVLLVTLAARNPLFSSETTMTLSHMISTFHTQPISQIALATDSACPSDYQKVTNLGYWAGTNQGCKSEAGWVQNGTCTKGSDGQNVAGTRALNLSLWEGQTFCIQRPKTLYYISLANECKPGHTKCSFDSCIDASVDSCPITSLKIVKNSEPTKEETEEETGEVTEEVIEEVTEEIAFDEERKLVIKRSSEEDASNFVTQLKATLYNSSCINPRKTPLPDSLPPYELSLQTSPGCYPYGSTENRDVLESVAASEFLQSNGIGSATIERLPMFADYLQGQSAYLTGIKKYATIDVTECKTVTMEDISRCRSIEEDFISASWPIAILLGLVTLGLIATIAFEVLIRVKAAEEQRILLRLVSYLNIGLLGFLFFLYFVNGLIALNARSDFNPQFYYLKAIRNQKCFIPQEMNNMMSRFVDEISADIYVIFALDLTLLVLGVGGMAMIGLLVLIDIMDLKKDKGYQPLGGNGNGKKKRNHHNKNKPEIELLLQNAH